MEQRPPVFDHVDAAAYLHRIVTRRGGRPFRVGDVKTWAKSYGIELSVEVIRELEQEHLQQYRSMGIVD